MSILSLCGILVSFAMVLQCGELSAQLAGALALSTAALPPGQVERAGACLPTATSLLVVEVEATGRRRPREAGRRVAPAQTAPATSAAVLMAGRRGADGALQRGGAARRGAGAAVLVVVVLRGAAQAADARPGGPVLGREAVVQGGARGAVHQLSDARQEVRVTVAASTDAVTSESTWEQKDFLRLKNKMHSHKLEENL